MSSFYEPDAEQHVAVNRTEKVPTYEASKQVREKQ